MKFLKLNFRAKDAKGVEKKAKKNRMFVLRKKQVVAVSLMILIGIAGYLNWSFSNDAVDPDVAVMYNEAAKKIGEAQMVSGAADEKVEDKEEEKKEETKTTSNAQPSDYFAQAKLEREVKRSEAMDMLTQLIGNQEADKEAKNNAQEQIQRMAEYTEKEVAVENMIRAKGFGQTIVFISEDMVSVALESEGLNEIDAAQIQDIVTANTGCLPSQIKIVEIRPGQ